MTVAIASPATPRRSRSLTALRLLLLSVVFLGAGAHTAVAQTTETYEGYTPNTYPPSPVTFGDFTYDADGGRVDVIEYGWFPSQALYWEYVSGASFEAAASAPAPTFELHGFRVFGWETRNFRIEGRRNGSIVYSGTVDRYGTTSGGVSLDGFADGMMLDGSLTFAGWTDIDEVRMYSEDNPYFELEIDDLTVTWGQPPADADGSVTAAATVSEPVAISTTVDTIGEAVDIFDFTISDGGSGDGLALDVSQIVLHASGTLNDTQRGNLTLRLNGPDASNVTGVYDAGADTYTFSGLSISVADGGNEDYTVDAYWNNNTSLTEGQTLILSTDGDTDFTVGGSGTQMGSTSAVTNGSGSTVDVTATTLAFTTQPFGSTSGQALSIQPVVTARDAFGNTDADFTETVTLTEASAGSLSNGTVAATSGVATFTNVIYTATADQQSFTLTANDQDGVSSDLPTADANAVTSDVIATTLAFATEPAPTTLASGVATSFTTVPVVQAVDANSVVDTGYSTGIVLSVTDPNDGTIDGAVNSLTGTGDVDGDGTTVTLVPSSGAATFTNLALQYTNIGASNDLALRAASGALTAANSTPLTSVAGPTVTAPHIATSGATGTGGAFKVGDTVTATWDNTAAGDNNAGVTGVTVDFSAFGGGAVAASNSGDMWTATYAITAGAIDGTDLNVSVTATNGTASTTTADATNATVDNVAPTVTDGAISISGATGTGGAFKVGDTVTATWDDTAGGDDNSDTIVGVTVDFSAFGGGAAIAASNSGDTWTATYTLTEGAIDATGLNISATATDDAGNTTTTADATNATVDTSIPSAPSTPDLVAASDTGDSITDDFTADATPTLTGTAEANATVTISSDRDGGLGTVAADGSGAWSFTPSTALSEGLHALTARATDNIGNTSTASSALSVTIDVSAPSAPAAPDLADASDPGFSASDDITDDTTPTLVGTTEADATVTISSDLDGVLGTTTADGSGAWSFTAAAVTEGTHDITLTASDAAGNTSSASAALTVTVTDLAPALAALDGDALAFTEGTEPQLLDRSTAATVYDADNVHFGGGQLVAMVVDAVADEGLSLPASAPLSLDGTTVLHDGVAVGSLLNAGHTLTVSFNGIASPSVVQDVVRQIAYGNTEAAPSPDPRTVRFTLDDGTGYSETAEVTVTVTPVNDAPVIAALETDALAYQEGDAPAALSATLTVGDPDGDALESASVAFSGGYVAGEDGLAFSDQSGISGSFDPATGTLTLTGSASASVYETALRTVAYTNAAGDRPTAGDRTLQIEVNDGALGSSPVARTVTVTSVNDAPVAADDADATDEDTPLTLDVRANDADADDDALTVSAVTQPANGMATIDGDGTVTYTPAENFVGSDSFTYTVTDGALTDAATVTVTVGAVNDAPAFTTEAATAATENALYRYDIAATDVEGDDLSIEADGLPAWLSLTDNGDGTAVLSGTPAHADVGAHPITLTVSDAALSTPQAFTVTVTDVENAPVATDDEAETEEDTPLTLDVVANDTDADGDALAVTAVSAPGHGTAEIADDGTVTYTPAADFSGTDAFTYTVGDGTLTDEATVTVTITPVDDAPVAVGDAYETDEDEALTIATPGLLANDTDVEGRTLTAEVVAAPENATLDLQTDGSFTLTPDADFHGTVSFTYRAVGLDSPSAPATVTVEVAAVNDAPVAADDDAATDEDTVAEIAVLANDTDVDEDPLSVTALQNPTAEGGTTTLRADGAVLYTPAPAFFGTDSFTYTVSDGNGGEVTATATVTVAPVNDAPVASDDDAATDEDEAVTITVLANDVDIDGDALTITQVTQPEHGAVVIETGTGAQRRAQAPSPQSRSTSIALQPAARSVGSADAGTPARGEGAGPVVRYTPTPDYHGPDSFTYTVSDGNGGTAEATVSLTVAPVNDAPVATDDMAKTEEDTPLAIDVLANDADADGDALTVTSVSAPGHGTAEVGDGGTVTYTPAVGFSGTDSFTYTVSDGQGGEAAAKISLVVDAINDVPVTTDDEGETEEDTPLAIDVLANDADADGDALTVTSVSAPEHGTAEIGDDGTVTYTPAADFFGADTFTYMVSDGNGGEALAKVGLTVLPVNDAPSPSSITAPEDSSSVVLVGPPDTPVTVAWTAAADVEDEALSYRWEAILGQGDFAEPLLTVETEGTSFDTTFAALDALLEVADVEEGESAMLRHRVVASDGEAETVGPVATVTLTRGALTGTEPSSLPSVFAVEGTYPNPSTGPVRIALDLPWPADVTVEVYDLAGRRVATRTEALAPGEGQNVSLTDLGLSTGMYLYRLRATSPDATEVAAGRFTVVR